MYHYVMALSTGPEYRVDELARAAGTTVRNVRAYQERGILPRPRRVGRVALYSEVHLVRLRLVGGLLERGYTLANIAELVEASERGEDLGAVLGLDAALVGPWTRPPSGTLSEDELVGTFGEEVRRRTDEAVAIGLLADEGSGTFRVDNPAALEAGRLLVAAGVPLDAVLAVARDLRAQVDTVAAAFVSLVDDHVVGPLGDLPAPEELGSLGALVAQLRPLVERLVAAALDRAMQDHIRRRLGEHLARLEGLGPDRGIPRPRTGVD